MHAWVLSAEKLSDIPAALLLSICRTRPPNGAGPLSRSVRRFISRVSIHPRGLCGFSVGINPTDIAELIIYEECFIRRIYDLAALPFQPDVVLDCGGFEGYFTLLARAWFPAARIIAFEPHPVNYRLMRANFERNGLKIDARREAVSNQAGELPFAGEGFGGSLFTGDATANAIDVRVTNLCELVSNLSPEALLLKLDVEGEESKILPDLVPLLPQTCAIFFESHDGEKSFEKLAGLLSKFGFALRRGQMRDERFVDAFALRAGLDNASQHSLPDRQEYY